MSRLGVRLFASSLVSATLVSCNGSGRAFSDPSTDDAGSSGGGSTGHAGSISNSGTAATGNSASSGGDGANPDEVVGGDGAGPNEPDEARFDVSLWDDDDYFAP